MTSSPETPRTPELDSAPDPAPSTARSTAMAAAVEQVARAIEADPSAAHTLASLAALAEMTPGRLRRAFRQTFGMTPAAYVRAVRVGRMRDALRAGRSVSQAGYEAGFGSNRAMYEHATRALGMPPSAYRRGGRGLRIRWATAASSLGSVLVGATERGVCCVLFAEDDASAEQALRGEFPGAVLERDDSAVAVHLERVVSLLSGDVRTSSVAGEHDLPLDLIGTPFQRRVWAELRRIPPGETTTYVEIARRIGEPSAVRAVAGACAANHAAVVVPCHRVVRSDGGLGGYKWGVARKEALLAEEAVRRDR